MVIVSLMQFYIYLVWFLACCLLLCICMCVCVDSVHIVMHRGQERASDLLELELQVVMSHPTWVQGNKTSFSARAEYTFNHRALPANPASEIYNFKLLLTSKSDITPSENTPLPCLQMLG